MSQTQLDTAAALGESVQVVHQREVTMTEDRPEDQEPENARSAVECPFCRQLVPYPGRLGNGEWPLAECVGCDLYFEVSDDEIFAADA